MSESSVDQQSDRSKVDLEGAVINENVKDSMEFPNEEINLKTDKIETISSLNSEKLIEWSKNESPTTGPGSDFTKRFQNMDNTFKENKFFKGLGNLMAGMKNKMTHNEVDTAAQQLSPTQPDKFITNLKGVETLSSPDKNFTVLFENQLSNLLTTFELSFSIMEREENSNEVVVHLTPENEALEKKLKQLKESLLELDEIRIKKNSLNEEITLYMKYFHSLKDLFEIKGSIYLEPLESRLQTLYNTCKTYLKKTEQQIKKYNAIMDKFENVAESREKELSCLTEKNISLKAVVTDISSKLDQALCVHQEIETMKYNYISTVIMNNIQQNNLNQSNLAAIEMQNMISEKKIIIKSLESEIEQIMKENELFKETISSQTDKIKKLEDEIAIQILTIDSIKSESDKKIQQLENEFDHTRKTLENIQAESIANNEKLMQLEYQNELDRRAFNVKTKSLQQLIQSLRKEKINNENSLKSSISIEESGTQIQQTAKIECSNSKVSNQEDINNLMMTIYSLKQDVQTLNDELNDKNIMIEQLNSDLLHYKNNSIFNFLMGDYPVNSHSNLNSNNPLVEANIATTLQTLVEDVIAKNLILEENVSTLAKEIERIKIQGKSSKDDLH